MVTINNVQMNFTTSTATFLQGCDMAIESLQEAFRLIENSDEGIMQPIKAIVKASGNENFTIDGSVKNALTLTLLPPYKMQFEAGAIPFQSSVGNLLGTFLESIGAIVQINNAVGALSLNNDAIEYSSYGGVVSLNTATSYTGTDYPVGNKEYHVNNIDDAVDICVLKGFDTVAFKGTLNLTGGNDTSGLNIQGRSPMTSIMTVEDASDTAYMNVTYANFSGALDGGSILRECLLGEVQYFSGFLYECSVTEKTIYINGIANITNCFNAQGCLGATPLDLANVESLTVTGHNGDLLIVNKTVDIHCKVHLNGEITIDASVTAGEFTIYGDAKVINNGTGTSIVHDMTTGTPAEIANAILDADAECV